MEKVTYIPLSPGRAKRIAGMFIGDILISYPFSSEELLMLAVDSCLLLSPYGRVRLQAMVLTDMDAVLDALLAMKAIELSGPDPGGSYYIRGVAGVIG